MTIDEVFKFFGNPSYRDVAKKLGVAHSQIDYYRKHGIPLGRQFMIQTQTKGALKADLPKLPEEPS